MKGILEDLKNEIRSTHPQERCVETGIDSVRDITERKHAEEEKWEPETRGQVAQNIEAIATLAGGIAHQFNNALVGITGNIELLKMDLPGNEILEKYIVSMETSVRKMTHMTSQLLAFAQGGKYQPRTISLGDFVKESLPLIPYEIDPVIRMETDLQGDLSKVEVDSTQMKMVLSALVANAVEAMEGPGRIRIIARNEKVEEEFAKHYPGLKPGFYACLIIEDDGIGMDEKTRTRVFEPFFTTKFQGRGLGLAAVYGIVKNHDGWIGVDSKLGAGTVVHIYLPATQAQVERAEELKTEESKGRGPILVVEEEPVLRM